MSNHGRRELPDYPSRRNYLGIANGGAPGFYPTFANRWQIWGTVKFNTDA
jgi:hypothetical protein